MNIAQHTWPLYYPGCDEPVLPELLEEARKAREEGGVVALLGCETSWHILHARQAEPTPEPSGAWRPGSPACPAWTGP
ncbi:hypothetical protein ACU639_27145 [Streptomyces cynarae]|uniref:hypothetical protein n=1 Tax=Streptomyces cynarae TaxID=2981134 RepID=UPI00406CA61A